MYELIARYKQGLEGAIRVTTSCYDIDVVFEGTHAYTHGRTIVLPNVDVFALYDEITDEAVEDARAYFMALKGYAWHEAGTIVETDAARVTKFVQKAGSFADAIRAAMDSIRIDHRFGKRGPGIAEAMEYTREQWIWPRFVRKRQESGTRSLLAETVYGLQVMMKHYEERTEHALWRVLSPEVQTFVERSADDLDSAHDTLKMDATPGTERLCDVTEHMLQRWEREWKAVAPLLSRRAAKKAIAEAKQLKKEKAREAGDDMSALDAQSEAEAIGELATSEGIPPLLLVTYGDRAITLEGVPFADGFVHHVEAVPTTPEGWDDLRPLAIGQIRTLVILPPDPALERALNEALSKYVQGLIDMGNAVAERAEEEMQQAERELDKLPPDDQPYLVYTTANDIYITTSESSLQAFKALQEQTSNYVGLMKKRLQILLRTQTRKRWRGFQDEGEHLDMPDAAARVAIARRIPNAELRPYQAQIVAQDSTDTLCGLLADVSGSMRNGGLGGYGIHASKLTLARWTTLCFAETLELSKFRFGIWAYTSDEDFWQTEMSKYIDQLQKSGLSEDVVMSRVNRYGRFGATHIETVKDFSESWLSVQTRLPNMGLKNDANYDADSLLWVGEQMLAQRAKRRVLFVLSDGQPATSEPAIQQARQQRQLKKVVESLTARSLEIVGVGICDASVKLYYPYSVVIHRAADLPKVIMNETEFLILKQRRHQGSTR